MCIRDSYRNISYTRNSKSGFKHRPDYLFLLGRVDKKQKVSSDVLNIPLGVPFKKPPYINAASVSYTHLVNSLPDDKNMVIFVGYQAEGTKGRAILEGASTVLLDKGHVKIRAEIKRIEGFSSHGDNNDLLQWLSRYRSKNLKKVFLTHADPERSEAFASQLNDLSIDSYIPNWKEVVELS